jgi:hypothetical protein
MTVILIGFHRKALSAQDERVTAAAEQLGDAEELDFLYHGDGRFSLRTLNGKFVRAWPNGKVDAEPATVKDWEIFRLVSTRNGRFAILTHHDLYLSAQPDGELLADRTVLSDWEEFYLHIAMSSDQLSGLVDDVGASRTEPIGAGTAGELYDFCVAHPARSEAALRTVQRTGTSVPPRGDAST